MIYELESQLRQDPDVRVKPIFEELDRCRYMIRELLKERTRLEQKIEQMEKRVSDSAKAIDRAWEVNRWKV